MKNDNSFFDDFWLASELNRFNIQDFGKRISIFKQPKAARLDFPMGTVRLPAVSSPLIGIAKDRYSGREFSNRPLSKKQIATILSSAGSFNNGKRRTFPAAGSLYTTEMFMVVFNGPNHLNGKVIYYDSKDHGYVVLNTAPMSWKEAQPNLNIETKGEPQALVIIASIAQRVTDKYSERGGRFALLEAGALMQQLSLTVAINKRLTGVALGGMLDNYWQEKLQLKEVGGKIMVGYLVGIKGNEKRGIW